VEPGTLSRMPLENADKSTKTIDNALYLL